MIRGVLRRGLGKARTVIRAARGFVEGPQGPGYGVSEYEDFERLRQEAAAQDRAEGISADGDGHEEIAEGTVEISAEDLRIMLEIELDEDKPLLVDVRESHEWAAGHIGGAVHVPLGQLEERADELDPTRGIVLYCAGGVRSIDGSYVLKRAGHPRVQSLAGGVAAWQSAGNELVLP